MACRGPAGGRTRLPHLLISLLLLLGTEAHAAPPPPWGPGSRPSRLCWGSRPSRASRPSFSSWWRPQVSSCPQPPRCGSWGAGAGLRAPDRPITRPLSPTPSSGSCWTRAPRTPRSSCTSGRQTKRTTREWSARRWPAGHKVSGPSASGRVHRGACLGGGPASARAHGPRTQLRVRVPPLPLRRALPRPSPAGPGAREERSHRVSPAHGVLLSRPGNLLVCGQPPGSCREPAGLPGGGGGAHPAGPAPGDATVPGGHGWYATAQVCPHPGRPADAVEAVRWGSSRVVLSTQPEEQLPGRGGLRCRVPSPGPVPSGFPGCRDPERAG